MVDYRKFKMNSNYQTDNVVYTFNGTITSGDGYSKTIDINHGLPFIPLPFGLYSLTGNTGDWLPINFSSVHGSGTLSSNGTKVSVSLYNNYGNLPGTVYIKIFAFAPASYTGSVVAPTPTSNFMINSDWTYDNLLAKGQYNLANDPNYQVIYTHNLGYRPRTMLWTQVTDYQGNPFVMPLEPTSLVFMSYFTSANAALITPTNLQFLRYQPSINTGQILHYRIYGGQNA